MIRTVADLLRAVRERELEAIGKAPPVAHPVMIGDMYEGLTRDLLELAIFGDLDLRVVEGKIQDRTGALTSQLDCMVVVGDGVQLPHTTHYVYDVNQVVAVVEVKKTLYRSELGDAYANLLTVAGRGDPHAVPLGRVLNPFRAITAVGLEAPDELGRLPLTQQHVFHTLVGEVLLPVRVAMGYSGYTSEYTLRRGFWQYLETRVGVPGYGPLRMPDLIIAGSNALVKLNGMPYALRQNREDWLLYGSVAEQSMLVLLELLWSRIASRFDLDPAIFGNDLVLEQINPLIEGRLHETPAGRGWGYTLVDVSARELERRPRTVPWQPAIVDKVEFVALNILCRQEEIDVDHDADLKAHLGKEGVTTDEYIERVISTGLAYLTPARKLRLLTTECLCAIDPKLGYVVAENHDGRLTRWLAERSDAFLVPKK